MVSVNARHVLTSLIALVAALFAAQASAALVAPGRPPVPGGDSEAVFQACVKDLVASGGGAAGSPHSTLPEDDSSLQLNPKGMTGGWASNSASISLVSGSGWGAAAIANKLPWLPQPSLQTCLSGDAAIILPAGLPFELLRPA